MEAEEEEEARMTQKVKARTPIVSPGRAAELKNHDPGPPHGASDVASQRAGLEVMTRFELRHLDRLTFWKCCFDCTQRNDSLDQLSVGRFYIQ